MYLSLFQLSLTSDSYKPGIQQQEKKAEPVPPAMGFFVFVFVFNYVYTLLLVLHNAYE